MTYPSFKEAARRLGVSRDVAKQRCYGMGWTLEEAFGVVERARKWQPKAIEVEGVPYTTLADAAKAYNIDAGLLASRLRNGRSIAGAFELPGADFEPHLRALTVRGTTFPSIATACRAHRVSIPVFHSRVKNGWSVEQALELEESPNGQTRCLGRIYKITHTETGRPYVGLTRSSIQQRWTEHVDKASSGEALAVGSIQEAIRTHGVDAFTVEEVAQAQTVGELARLERHYIIHFDSRAPKGFNLAGGGGGVFAKGKPILVYGTKYASVAEACKALGSSTAAVRARLKGGMPADEAFARAVRPTVQPVAFRGVLYESHKALAAAYGTKYSVFKARKHKGRSLEQALDLAELPAAQTAFEFKGRKYTSLKVAAAELGLSYNTVIGRRAKGLSLEEALAPAKSKEPKAATSLSAPGPGTRTAPVQRPKLPAAP